MDFTHKFGLDYRYYYLVEGECEKKILEAFKERKGIVLSGKISVVNVVQERITNAFLRTIQDNTIFILVFDTDTSSIEILEENIVLLKKNRHVKEVWIITEVLNLEDELIRSTNVSEVRTLTGSRTNSEYKHDLIKEKRLMAKLEYHEFRFDAFWVTSPTGVFGRFTNDGKKIRLNN